MHKFSQLYAPPLAGGKGGGLHTELFKILHVRMHIAIKPHKDVRMLFKWIYGSRSEGAELCNSMVQKAF